MLIFIKNLPSYTLIPTYTFINIAKIVPPTLLFQPTRLFGTLEQLYSFVSIQIRQTLLGLLVICLGNSQDRIQLNVVRKYRVLSKVSTLKLSIRIKKGHQFLVCVGCGNHLQYVLSFCIILLLLTSNF